MHEPSVSNAQGAGSKTSINVVIVTYNSARYLERLASSLKRSLSYNAVIVVDNCSLDESVTVARRLDWGGPLHVIENCDNVGFGVAVNQGARLIHSEESDFLLLVNPDVQLSSDTVPKLLDALQEDEALACVGPRLHTSDGKPVSSARALPTARTIARRRVEEQTSDQDGILEVGWVCGALMLWKRDAWTRVGGFSPEYFLYYEDVDICRKAWGIGLKIATVPSARAVHDQGHGEVASPALQVHSRRSRRTYARKWLGFPGVFAANYASAIEKTAGALKSSRLGKS